MTEAEVSITVVDLDGEKPGDREILNTDERERADRFPVAELRRRYVAGRAAVRRALGEVVDSDPSGLMFDYSPYGRPDLVGHDSISFNYTNSGAIGIIAISRSGRVGIDVEVIRPDFADLRIAERSFAPAEVARLRALPHEERNLAFLRCWTRKEALLKAVGGGLTLGLR
ncbi:MAG: 4'-phosphopantetheinyl transferase superfamily protein, partial [Mycobacteriales bacterium]